MPIIAYVEFEETSQGTDFDEEIIGVPKYIFHTDPGE